MEFDPQAINNDVLALENALESNDMTAARLPLVRLVRVGYFREINAPEKLAPGVALYQNHTNQETTHA